MSSLDLIDVSAQPAIASWNHDSGASRSLDGLRFHIYHDPSTSTAFFKLRATVTFKATSVKSKRTTAAWLHIAPERVETIALEDEKNVDEAVSRKLGPNSVCWHFSLSRPGALVLPPDYDLKSKGQQSDDPLDGLSALARATSFSISACLPGRTVSRGRLTSLCKAVSGGDSTASTTAEVASAGVKLTSNKHAADTASLYGGKGGQVVELDSLDLPGPAGNEASPPPYTDIGPSPPFVTDTPAGKKRRRRTSSEASATPYRQDNSKVIEDKTAFVKALKDDLKAELMSELRAEVKAELRDQVKAELVKEVVQEIERRILGRVEDRLQEQADDFEKQLYDLRHEVGATIYSEVEDQTYAARKELEDFVQEEMEEAQKRVEERIVDRLESANMNIRFNDR